MEVIVVAVFASGWMRLLGRIGIPARSALIPSLVLACGSWVVTIQLIGAVLSSPTSTLAGVVLAGVVSLLILGWVWPGGRLARFLEHRAMLR
jgi:hypothetical protein